LEAEDVVAYPSLSETDPGQAIVFGEGFPRPGGRARFTPAKIIAPAEIPDSEYPLILTTGRQLEHWHTGSMTRRAHVLDTIEPQANASLSPRTMRRLGIMAGDMITVETRRGSISIMARADRAVSDDMVFVPFAYVEAAANILTNPQVDPYGKIPEFKFAACQISKTGTVVAE
jgi:formate dehydrogenase major subunit